MTARERKARLDMENFCYDNDPYGYIYECGENIKANALGMTLEERKDILQELLEEMEEEADIKAVTNLLNEFCKLLEENGR